MPKKFALLIIVTTSICIGSCKKGEDDPAISLRSRKARVAGEWRMTSGKASYTHSTYNESYTFDGINVKVNVSSYPPAIYTGKYKLNLSFTKDGTVIITEDLAGSKFTANGT